jgi:hypothetical protein
MRSVYRRGASAPAPLRRLTISSASIVKDVASGLIPFLAAHYATHRGYNAPLLSPWYDVLHAGHAEPAAPRSRHDMPVTKPPQIVRFAW